MRGGPILLLLAGLLVLGLGLFACHSKSGTVTGTASYGEPIGLPGNAMFEARLVDLSASPGEKHVLAETRIAPIPGLPLNFALKFSRAAIKPAHAYGLEATIEVDKQVWFSTAAPVLVLTHGHGETADLVLHRGRPPKSQGNPEAAAAAIDRRLDHLTRLEGTYRYDGRPASYAAYIERGSPVLIKVGRQDPSGGSAALAFYYQGGLLIRCEEDSLRQAAKPGPKEVVRLVLNFDGGAFSGGSKTVNGKAEPPGEADIAEAESAGAAVQERVMDRLGQKSAPH